VRSYFLRNSNSLTISSRNRSATSSSGSTVSAMSRRKTSACSSSKVKGLSRSDTARLRLRKKDLLPRGHGLRGLCRENREEPFLFRGAEKGDTRKKGTGQIGVAKTQRFSIFLPVLRSAAPTLSFHHPARFGCGAATLRLYGTFISAVATGPPRSREVTIRLRLTFPDVELLFGSSPAG
jgi:hypothetical protein